MSATIPTQTVPQIGAVIGNQACDVTETLSDTVTAGVVLVFRNTGGSARQVTLAVPGDDQFGNPKPDLVFSVASGQMYFVRAGSEFKDPSDGLVHIAYDNANNMTVRAVSL